MTKPLTSSVVRRRLDLTADPLDVVRRLRGRDRLVALLGRWAHGEALISADPVVTLDPATDDVFDAVNLPDVAEEAAGAFGGGWIGAWGYQLGRRVERLPAPPQRPVAMPEAAVGFYDWVLRRTDGQWWLETIAPNEQRDEQILALLHSDPAVPLGYEVGDFALTPSPREHQDAVARVLDHIGAGDIFQANLCARLEASFEGDPLDVFCQGVQRLAPAYAAFIATPQGAIASLSPELFIRRSGRHVITSPIKGTAPLTADPAELVASGKNRAENIMIVDLMRNDLGRVCEPGSVQVTATVRAEKHAVWHLVSDVEGTLRDDVRDGDLLRATFPPGSVTGAPKVRAMEIINALEATGREAYTGAIGHVSAHAGVELNVAIRTFEFAAGRVWLGVGGGIVADSTPQAEYAEILVKARPLIDAIGGTLSLQPPGLPTDTRPEAPAPAEAANLRQGIFTTVLVRDGQAVDASAHAQRLTASVRALWGCDCPDVEPTIRAAAATLTGTHRLRVQVEPTEGGQAQPGVRLSTTSAPFEAGEAQWTLGLATVQGGLGAHKWVDRARIPATAGDDALLVDADGSVLETSRANFFAVFDDAVVTPALDGRILPGTMRARVLDGLKTAGIPVFERRLALTELADATEVFATNALRGVVPVTGIDGVGQWNLGATTAWAARAVAGERVPQARRSAPDGREARVLFIDNYDSFVYNLVQYVGQLGAQATVVRNDAATVEQLVAACERGQFTHVVISPGPGAPADAGVSVELVRRVAALVPVLGVCLGHQAIAEAFGGSVVRADQVVHGKPSLIHHDGQGLFEQLPSPLVCARYHSLVADEATLPAELEVTARTASGTVMALAHRSLPVFGVQMHPESILTQHGHALLANFLAAAGPQGTAG